MRDYVQNRNWRLCFFIYLFDSGVEIICMNMETVPALGLLSKITDSSVTVNKASGQNMGVAGDI